MFDSQWTCNSKNSPEFERAVAVMHMSSLWMLGEEEELFGDLTGCSSGRQNDESGLEARIGSGEWMRLRIMRLPMPFIEWRREGRRYCGGETVNDEWSYSMLLFQEEESNGQHPFRNGKGTCKAALGSYVVGHRRMLRRCGVRQWRTTGVGRRLN
jgi:hypothetical protein